MITLNSGSIETTPFRLDGSRDWPYVLPFGSSTLTPASAAFKTLK
jgi:hypothetical protein